MKTTTCAVSGRGGGRHCALCSLHRRPRSTAGQGRRRGADRRRRRRRRRHERERAGGGRLGDRRDDATCRRSSSRSSSPTIAAATCVPGPAESRAGNVWVRGYGLVDSPKVQAAPGKNLNLTAVVAPNARAAAEYYPAGYWFSLIEGPGEERVPRHRARRQRHLAERSRARRTGFSSLKSGGCTGVPSARAPGHARDPEAARARSSHPTEAWDRRIQSGQAGAQMSGGLNAMGRERALAMFADWTDRITGGELPPAPPRPQGVERNVVITQWDWADPKAHLHDRGVDRPAQSHAQRQRSDLRIARAQRRLPAGPRSGPATRSAR